MSTTTAIVEPVVETAESNNEGNSSKKDSICNKKIDMDKSNGDGGSTVVEETSVIDDTANADSASLTAIMKPAHEINVDIATPKAVSREEDRQDRNDDENVQVDNNAAMITTACSTPPSQEQQTEEKVSSSVKEKEERHEKSEMEKDDTIQKLQKENARLNSEVQKVRQIEELTQQREALSTSRLNDSKKKEAISSQLVQKYSHELTESKASTLTLQGKLEEQRIAKEKLESMLEKIKVKTIEKIRSLEDELTQERGWNEERKGKMKMFIQTKANELSRISEEKEKGDKELHQTRLSLRSVRCDYDAVLATVSERNEVIDSLRESIEHLQKNTTQLETVSLDYQKTLEVSTKETEEHKVKRLTAKHEVLTILRKLEVEQAVTSQLRDVIKCTFVPKTLSQQQLLSEGNTLLMDCIARMNFHPTGTPSVFTNIPQAGTSTAEQHTLKQPPGSDVNTTRLISNLETESQKVSQNIMLLLSNVEQLQHLLTEQENRKGCVEALGFWLGASNNTPMIAAPDTAAFAVQEEERAVLRSNGEGGRRATRGARGWSSKNINKPRYGPVRSTSNNS